MKLPRFCPHCGTRVIPSAIQQLLMGPVDIAWFIFVCSHCDREFWVDLDTGEIYTDVKNSADQPIKPLQGPGNRITT